MKQHTVCFLPEGIQCTVESGTTLLQALRMARLHPDAPCGGNGSCGKCRVTVDHREVLACQTQVDRDLTVMLPQNKERQILTWGRSTQVQPDGEYAYGLAIDIGTTTVVACLLDGKTGELLARKSCPNPQSQYGADVISRIRYALSDSGDTLGSCIRGCLEQLTLAAAEEARIPVDSVTVAAIAGNTAMHHLLLGIDAKPLVTPPYMPGACEAMELSAHQILPIGGTVRLLPNIAGFVGGDMVGCMLATGFDRLEALTLMIDIGTNGELVLGNRSRQIVCSTAAGPAFEGANISCGMCAVEGAIDHVWVEDGALRYHVIGEGTGVGICGSGLLDLVAALLELGVIDESGHMQNKQYPLGDTQMMLTQKDVREVQLAKASIRAGVELLTQKMQVDLTDIRQVYLAGAFGSYMKPASACRIGMIPSCLQEQIVPIGNAACEGAKLCALSRNAFDHCKSLAKGAEFLELASLPQFQDVFVDALEFSEEAR